MKHELFMIKVCRVYRLPCTLCGLASVQRWHFGPAL